MSSEPMGIFVIVNKSEEELLEKRIGSVSLSYFTRDKKEEAAKYARICVSVPPEKFKEVFFMVVCLPIRLLVRRYQIRIRQFPNSVV